MGGHENAAEGEDPCDGSTHRPGSATGRCQAPRDRLRTLDHGVEAIIHRIIELISERAEPVREGR